MRRKMFFAERMLHGDGKVPFNTVIPVKIKGGFSEENLRHALKKLQEKHPLLNAFVYDDEHKVPWFVVNEWQGIEIPVRICARKTDDDWRQESMKEWEIPFDTQTGPLMRIVWIKGEEVSELMTVFHHCLCDGGSAMAIINEILVLLDDGTVNIGKEDPILNLWDIIPPAILKNRTRMIKAKLIGKMATFILWLVPVKKKAVERKKDYLIHWKLEKRMSDALILKCRSAGVTVNTALCVAVLEAFKAVRENQFHNKISCPVDIRRFAPQIKKDNIFAFGLMLVVSTDQTLDFFNNVRKMQEDVDRKILKLDPYATIMMMEESHGSLDNFTNFLKYGKSSNDCMFSNLGKIPIPYQYQKFEVETIYSPSVMGPLGNTTTLITSTYRGRMDFSFIASEGFIPYDDALAIKEKMIEILESTIYEI